jgi:DNA-binding NtrC family response regulator
MILIVSGVPTIRNALQEVLQRGPIPVSVCADWAEVNNVSSSSSEPVSIILYDADRVRDQDLLFLKDIREGRYEHIRCGVPFMLMYRTMNASLLRETHRLDAIAVEKSSQVETPSLYKSPSPACGWPTTQSSPTIH